jgi:hypothetical protein
MRMLIAPAGKVLMRRHEFGVGQNEDGPLS